jgi:hypothetical protein
MSLKGKKTGTTSGTGFAINFFLAKGYLNGTSVKKIH